MTIVSISQPAYLPWLGFFEKMLYSDIFVFLDDVKFQRGFNRNQIRIKSGQTMLTVPLNSKSGNNLNQKTINYSTHWNKQHSDSIRLAYLKTDFFSNYWDELNKIYEKPFEKLIDLNIALIEFVANKMNIKTKTILSSKMGVDQSGSNRILEICKELNADVYLSGIHGKDYLSIDDFKNNEIKLEFQNFQHPEYRQKYEPFLPNMAAIDLLFNEGNNSFHILNSAKIF